MLFDFDRFERERLAREASASGSSSRGLAPWWLVLGILACAVALGAALWSVGRFVGPAKSVVAAPSLKMHVAEVTPTEPNFAEPTRVVADGTAYWRVAIRDAEEHPLVGVLVQMDVLAADGAVRAQPVTTTNPDGLALFRYALPAADAPQVYTVRVVNLFHTLHPEAVYDRAANAAWSSSFSVSGASRP